MFYNNSFYRINQLFNNSLIIKNKINLTKINQLSCSQRSLKIFQNILTVLNDLMNKQQMQMATTTVQHEIDFQ